LVVLDDVDHVVVNLKTAIITMVVVVIVSIFLFIIVKINGKN
jgi:hypothetical protein